MRALKDALAPKPVADAAVAGAPEATPVEEIGAVEEAAAQPKAEAPEPEPVRPTTEEEVALSAHFLAHTPLLDGTRAELSARRGALDALRGEMATTLITVALEEPRVTRVLPRGNWLDESGPVSADTLSALPPLGADGRRATRLDLAGWWIPRIRLRRA